MRARPVIALSAGLVLLAAPLVAALDAAPAQATASSGFTLLGLDLGSTSVQVLDVELGNGTTGGATFSVTPLRLNGTPFLQTSPPAGSQVDVPDSGDLVPGAAPLASVVVPALGYTVAGPEASTGAFALPQVTALGLPIRMTGTAAMTSTAAAGGSQAQKTLVISDLGLPSVADLLATRGVDVQKLPLDVLRDLVTGLGVVTPAFTTAADALTAATASVQSQVVAAQGQVDTARAALLTRTADLSTQQAALAAAQTQLEAAVAALVPLQATLTQAQATYAAAQAAVTAATSDVAAAEAALAAALIGLPLASVTDPLVQSLNSARATLTAAQADLVTAKAALDAAEDAVTAAQTSIDTAQAARDALTTAVATAQTAVSAAQATLDAAVAALAQLLTAVPAEIGALAAAAVDALDSTPLLSLDQLEVTTRAATSTGSQTAELVSGQVRGLRVLSVPVVPALALADVTSPVEALLDSALASATTTLSSVLGRVGIALPAPTVDLLARSTTTSDAAGLGSANTSLSALTLSWPALTVPSPYTSGPASSGLTLRIGTLREAATYRAAVAGDAAPAPVDPAPAELPPAAPVAAAPVDPPSPSAPPVAAPVVEVVEPAPAPADPDAAPDQPGTAPPASAPEVPATAGGPPPGAGPPTVATDQQLPSTGLQSQPSVLALLLLAAGLGVHRRHRTA